MKLTFTVNPPVPGEKPKEEEKKNDNGREGEPVEDFQPGDKGSVFLVGRAGIYKEPKITGNNPFSDVNSGDYYYPHFGQAKREW